MTQLKIGIFTDSYKPYTSGVVRSIDTFASELIAIGHEIFIFAPKYPNCKEEDNVFRFPSIPAPTNPDYTLAVPFSLRLSKIIHNLNLDIIHVHSPFLLGRLGAWYAKKLEIPLIFTFHTLYEEYVHYVPFAHDFTKDLTQRFCSEFCNQCDLVVTPTTIIKEHIKANGVKTRVINIPTGIKVDEFATGNDKWLREKFQINPNKKILLFVGRLGKEKNLEWLLESIANIFYELPDTQLVLVGGGPEKELLTQKTIDLGISNNVTFTGVLTKEQVIDCYHGSDLFVFASLTETQGLVIGEAKSAGLPVVAVKAYGVTEMVENEKDGFLTSLSKDEFSNRIKLLLKNENLRIQMSNAAKENAQKISARNCALKLLLSYEELIEYNKEDSSNKILGL